MEKITLTQETIDEISSFRDYLLVAYFSYSVDETSIEIHQGDCSIQVDFSLKAIWVEDKEVHNEVTPPNIEDLSHYEYTDVTIKDVYAFDKDGNDLEITNREQIFK